MYKHDVNADITKKNLIGSF